MSEAPEVTKTHFLFEVTWYGKPAVLECEVAHKGAREELGACLEEIRRKVQGKDATKVVKEASLRGAAYFLAKNLEKYHGFIALSCNWLPEKMVLDRSEVP
jgi:hypothetical protein